MILTIFFAQQYSSGNYFRQEKGQPDDYPYSKEEGTEIEEIIIVDIDYGAWLVQLLIWCSITISVSLFSTKVSLC